MNQEELSRAMRALAAIGAGMCLAVAPCAAQSAEPEGSGIRLSGFGTLGVVHAQAPAGWGFLRSIEQPPSTRSTRLDLDSRLGMQLNYAASAQIELVGQFLARRRASSAAAADAIEWAFAAYRPTAELTLRAGRLNLDQFVMSDYRNVGFAYLYARPPVEYYATIPSNLDGVDVTQTWNLDDVRWRAKGFVGRSKTIDIPLTNVVGVAVSRESDGLLLRAGWSRARFARNNAAVTPLLDGLGQIRALPVASVSAQADRIHSALDLAAKPLVYATLGATYEQTQWQYAAEVTRLHAGQAIIMAGYVSVGRRIGDVTVFSVLSSSSSDHPALASPDWGAQLAPVIGPAAAAQAQMLGTVSAYAASQSIRQATYSLGTRWDIHPRMALKAQWDRVKIKANGSYLWSNATNDPGSANITTVLLDFVF